MSLFGFVFVMGGIVALYSAKVDVPMLSLLSELRDGGITGLVNFTQQAQRHPGALPGQGGPSNPFGGTTGGLGIGPTPSGAAPGAQASGGPAS